MFGISLLKLYFTIIGGSILSSGIFTYLGVNAKSYQETKKWEKYLQISIAVCTTAIGAGIVTLLWL